MAIDRKFGKVTLENPHSIADDEPVFVFRARDLMLLAILREYYRLCEVAGSPSQHLTAIVDAMAVVDEWQKLHGTKVPT